MLIDIGANLTDPQYTGCYNHSDVVTHKPDLANVLQRAHQYGVGGIIITGGNVEESLHAVNIANTYGSPHGGSVHLWSTVGCHPTRCSEFDQHGEGVYLDRLRKIITDHKTTVVAIGECGLDYDRTHFCPADVQRKNFPFHFQLSREFGLPFFFHDRNTSGDFDAIVREHRGSFTGGVVHSFTGSEREMRNYIHLGLHIGLNGCSLKTEENCRVASLVPLDKLLLETDCPWCDIRGTHASHGFVRTNFDSVKKEKYVLGKMVKGRNEPCTMVQVLEAVHGIQLCAASPSTASPTMDELQRIVYTNTVRLFQLPLPS